MKFRLALGFALSMLVAGCSFHYELEAVVRDGRLLFQPKDHQGTGCFSDFTIRSETGEVVWEVGAGQYLSPPCDNRLPVIYGVVPAGMEERVRAEPLRDGVLYRIEAWDGDSYSGAFWLRQGMVVNVYARR
jgi:hypothetical protein